MKLILATILIAMSMAACTSSAGTPAPAVGASGFTEEEKHRLYAAALAANESPLESETFKTVCRKIEIFDAQGNSNNNYMAFVKAHIEWAMKTETEPFKREINTREKAREYLKKYLR